MDKQAGRHCKRSCKARLISDNNGFIYNTIKLLMFSFKNCGSSETLILTFVPVDW